MLARWLYNTWLYYGQLLIIANIIRWLIHVYIMLYTI